jgi:hypothetical protein
MKKMLVLTVLMGSFALLSLSFTSNPFTPQNSEWDLKTTSINGSPVVFTQVVHLEGDNEIPAVPTDAKGIAILRMTQDRKLYSKIMVHKLNPETDGDLLFAHIHRGTATENGGVMVFLAHDIDDFGENMVQTLSLEHYNAILNAPLYVNAHSTVYRGGIVRGQIR